MNRSDKNINENKNICRPTLVFYVIHYYIFFIKKKDFLYHTTSNEPFIWLFE